MRAKRAEINSPARERGRSEYIAGGGQGGWPAMSFWGLSRQSSRICFARRNNAGQKGRDQLSRARARALRIYCGRRSGRLAGHELLGVVAPILQNLLCAQEQHGPKGQRSTLPRASEGAQNILRAAVREAGRP